MRMEVVMDLQKLEDQVFDLVANAREEGLTDELIVSVLEVVKMSIEEENEE